jgi:predicted metal-dependent hydrolase
MNLNTFSEEYENLSTERRRNYANRVLNELTKRINQEYAVDGESDTFTHDILPVLIDLEEYDFFGTEGFDA